MTNWAAQSQIQWSVKAREGSITTGTTLNTHSYCVSAMMMRNMMMMMMTQDQYEQNIKNVSLCGTQLERSTCIPAVKYHSRKANVGELYLFIF